MGQQQLLLLVLAAVIVGLAVVTGINMFGQNALQANQDAIRQDLLAIASEAQSWYRRPVALGGGGNTFVGLTGAAGWTAINYNSGGAATFVNTNATYAWGTASATGHTITGTSIQDHDGDATLMLLTATVTPNAVTIAVTTAD
jgi:hypothetical protein